MGSAFASIQLETVLLSAFSCHCAGFGAGENAKGVIDRGLRT
jgi:hypothetical protein